MCVYTYNTHIHDHALKCIIIYYIENHSCHIFITSNHVISECFSSVQSLSCVQLFVTPWTAAHQASLSITNSWSLHKLMSIQSVMPSNHLILCHPLFLPPSTFSIIRVFSNELVLYSGWPSTGASASVFIPSNEYLGLISFRMDWLDLL